MGNSNDKTSSSAKSNITAATDSDSRVKNKLHHAFNQYFNSYDQQIKSVRVLDFQKALFPRCPELGKALFNLMARNDEAMIADSYVDAGYQILTSVADARLYISMFADGNRRINANGFRSFLNSAYSLCRLGSETLNDNLLTSMTQSLFHQDDDRDVDACESWLRRHSPNLVSQLHSLVCSHLSADASTNSAASSNHEVYSGSHLLSVSVAWALSTSIDSFYISSSSAAASTGVVEPSQAILNSDQGWDLLYSSMQHGLSFNRLKHHVLSYKAPTVLLISFDKFLFCVGVDTEWIESVRVWGGSRCFLLQVQPEYKMLLSGGGMVYLNVEDRTATKGLRLGTDSKNPTLVIDEELANVKHYWIDYKIHSVEVWGCGGSSASQAQQQQRKWELKDTEKHKDRKLKIEDWKDNPDRMILEMGGVTTEHAEK